jgi:hypothetical protein
LIWFYLLQFGISWLVQVYVVVYVCPSVCLSVCLSVNCLTICLYVCLSIHLSVGRSVGLSICPFDCVWLCLLICLYICMSMCMSGCLTVYRPVSLGVGLSDHNTPIHLRASIYTRIYTIRVSIRSVHYEGAYGKGRSWSQYSHPTCRRPGRLLRTRIVHSFCY